MQMFFVDIIKLLSKKAIVLMILKKSSMVL